MANTADSVLSVARGEIGYSRWNDAQTGTKYGRWYAAQTGESWYGANGVAYCAMYVSWVFAHAGAKCAGIPGAYCPTVLSKAKAAGRVVANVCAQAGDVVLFNWDGGVVDHIGIVEKNCGSYLQTIEGNTSNGCVKRRTRAWSVVAAIIRPYYDKQTSTNTGSNNSSKIDVDGYWGSATTRRLQQVLGTPQDGIVSSQNAHWKHAGIVPGLTSGWEWVSNPTGSTVMRAIQARIGAGADGILGPGTIKALEAHYGIAQDGRLDAPSLTVKRLQEALNRGTI